MRDDMVLMRKVKNYMAETKMTGGVRLILAGVSGGSDSMAMLDMLDRMKKEEGFLLCAVHVNHGIRGAEALRDQKQVEAFCAQRGIPCSVYAFDVPAMARGAKEGLEETGRRVRRGAFSEERKKYPEFKYKEIRIALAHNKNDLAETMLHHLARGTGLRGLSSMKPAAGGIIRPVLCLERREIEDYIRMRGIISVTDSTNLENDYTRNRIRNHILPLLEQEVNPRAVEHMAETSRLLSQAEEFLCSRAEAEADRMAGEAENICCAGENSSAIKKEAYFLDEDFFHKEEILQTYTVRVILERLAGRQKDLTAVHIRQVLALRKLQCGRRIELPYGIGADRVYAGVRLSLREKNENAEWKEAQMLRKKSEAEPGTFSGEKGFETEKIQEEWRLPLSGELKCPLGSYKTKTFSYFGQKILEKKCTKWLDCAKIKGSLTLRSRKSGDYLVIGRDGGQKKLTRIMIDDKIPKENREKIPLVASGSEILWIVGGRISEKYKITPGTREVLEITWEEAENE